MKKLIPMTNSSKVLPHLTFSILKMVRDISNEKIKMSQIIYEIEFSPALILFRSKTERDIEYLMIFD